MSIKTDSAPLEAKKNADLCNIYKLYRLLATQEEKDLLKSKYQAGNFGYGHAKQELFELICNKFSKERERFEYLMENRKLIDNELEKGAEKAREVAKKVLARVRSNIGYNN